MAGGNFLSQNKLRPGAYLNFKGVSKPLNAVGSRGIMTMPVAMGWGATITELLSTDLLDGKCLEKIGYTVYDDESQIFREALKNAYKAIIYRLDTGGVKAAATIAPLTATAKYAGIVGNSISIAIVANGSAFDVITYFKGIEKDRQTATTVAGLVSNAWVDFSGTGSLVANAGTALTSGANGTVSTSTYSTYRTAIKAYAWNVMAIPQDESSIIADTITFIQEQRDTYGKKVQAVLYDATADYEGIISCAQGYQSDTETVSPTTFIAYLAGLTAGSEPNKSNTYHVIPGAISIVYPSGVTPYTDAEIEAALAAGKLVLSTRQDGAVVIEQDINTLHTYTVDRSYAFSKNRVIRTLDEINNAVRRIFENSYIGKIDNNVAGRNLLKADVIAYMNRLQALGAIQNFDSASDIAISAGESLDGVVADLAVQPVDAMEKLYMTVVVG